MPRGLKIHANERIDIPDFRMASKYYSDLKHAFDARALYLSRRSRFVEGFRIELSNQATNPGELTVYNGMAWDRLGLPLNNEDQVNDSRTITLVGASTDFYLEIEYVEDDADPDARAFWDSVYDNPAPDPDGREFSATVPTRLAPNWRIVTPVSTTGFDATANPDSTRIPLAILSTNPGNQITGPGSLTQVTAASVLEEDVLAGVSSVRILNSRIFPDTGDITIDAGGTSPQTVTLLSNDRDNGILTFNPVLAANHLAGAIVRVALITARFLEENVDPADVAVDAGSATHSDARRRFFQGDEYRGSAIGASKETAGARDDLNIESFKDYIDFVSAQMRDLRWGSFRPDTSSKALPTSFTSTRYYDHSGGIMGSRGHTISIGDGTNSWGDFNGTTDAVFTAAVAAMPASGGTIYVKRGTYTFSNAVAVAKPIVFVGEGIDAVTLVKAAGPAYSLYLNPGGATSVCGVSGMTLTLSAATTAEHLRIGTGTAVLRDLTVEAGVTLLAGATVSVVAENCVFDNTSAIAADIAFDASSANLFYSSFSNCEFTTGTANTANRGFSSIGALSAVTFTSCEFSSSIAIDLASAVAERTTIENSTITGVAGAVDMSAGAYIGVVLRNNSISGSASVYVVEIGGSATNCVIDSCYVTATFSAAVGTVTAPNAFVYFNTAVLQGMVVSKCYFLAGGVQASTHYMAGVRASGCTMTRDPLRVEGCNFYRCMGVVNTNSVASSALAVTGCKFNGAGFSRSNYGIYSAGAGAENLFISDCLFSGLESNVSEVAAVYFDSTNNNGNLTMSNCQIESLEQTSGGIACGVRFRSGSSTGVATISNCAMRSIVGASGAYGVWYDGATSPSALRMSNVQINTITATTAGDAVGLYATYFSKSSVIGCRFMNISGISSSRCVWMTSVADVTVANNHLEDQLIAEGFLNNLSILGNIIAVNASIIQGCIRIYYTDGSYNINASDNTIQTPSGSSTYGVEIAGSTATATVYQLVVARNIIRLGALGGQGVWFSVGESVGLSIVENQVDEATFAATTRAVYVSSGTAFGHQNASVSRNKFYGSTKTANRANAIEVLQVLNGQVSDNTVDIGAGGFTGDGIYIEDFTGSVNGNTVIGTNTAAGIRLVGTAGASFIIVSGNYVSAGTMTFGIRAQGSSNVTYVGGPVVAHSTLGAQAGIVAYGYNIA